LQNYFSNSDVTFPTDRVFRRGLRCILHLDTAPTAAKAKKLADSWQGPKAVGSMFCMQVGNYHARV
jgi:hypothetical protein